MACWICSCEEVFGLAKLLLISLGVIVDAGDKRLLCGLGAVRALARSRSLSFAVAIALLVLFLFLVLLFVSLSLSLLLTLSSKSLVLSQLLFRVSSSDDSKLLLMLLV